MIDASVQHSSRPWRFGAAAVVIAASLIAVNAQNRPGASDAPDNGAVQNAALPAMPLSAPGWTAGPVLPSNVVRAVGVYFSPNGKFYAMGGRTSDSPGSDLTHPLEYNPYTNTWTTKGATYPDNQVNNMACGQLSFSGAPRIVCVGGSAAGSVTATQRVLVYDPLSDAITTLTSSDNWLAAGTTILPGGFAVYANQLFIIGGFNINVGMTNQTWRFDPSGAVGSRWLQMADYPVARGYVPATTIDGYIYTGGGSDFVAGAPSDTTNSYRYNPGTNSWTAIASIPRATGETRAVTINGRMWVLGGGRTAPNPSNEVDIYNPGTNSWSTTLFATARRNFPADSNGTLSGLFLGGGYGSDGITPLDSMELFNSARPTVTFTGALGSGSPGIFSTSGTQTNRVARADPDSTCANPKSYPGTVAGSFTYDAYRFVNTSGVSECVSVAVTTACESIHMSAYLNVFDPTNIGTNWVADIGGSPLGTKSFSFLLPAGNIAILVASNVSAPAGCAYTVQVAGTTSRLSFDTNHDLLTDRTIYRPGSSAVWYSAVSNGTSTATPWGTTGDIDVMGDYDGDGKADPTIFRPSAGAWFILQSSTGTVRTVLWGTTGDIPLTGDIDGDGKDDIVVYRPSAGTWYINFSSGGSIPVGWGASTDTPLIADFDGDGRRDIAVYRPSTGTWYVAYVSGGTAFFGWGTAGDIPVTGNWDGDAKADGAIFRPSTGQWFIRNSSGGTTVASWGTNGDVPLTGDMDGDGTSDYIVYRNGTWFTQFSSGGSAAAVWGIAGDKPVGRVPGS